MDGSFHIDTIDVLIKTYGTGRPADGQIAKSFQSTARAGWPRFSLAVQNLNPTVLRLCHIYAIIYVYKNLPLRESRMPFTLSNTEALGRTYAAARMMAGLDQAGLASAAGLSAGTISNVERGRDSKRETLRAIRRALSREGVLIAFSPNNGLASVSISFAADEGEEE